MIAELIAALVVAAAPAAPQPAAQREPGKANAEAKARTDGNVTARERARIAKAQNKDLKCGTKPTKEGQKKATAT